MVTGQAALRSYGDPTPSLYHNRLKPTVDLLCILASLPELKGTVELRLLPFPPSFGLVLIDPDQADGTIYVEVYPHRTLEQNPVFALDARRDSRWYQVFRRQFQVLWDSAREAKPSDGYDLHR